MDIWTKETYLAALERELRPMDPQERLEALEYYREYLEEAGPERERQVLVLRYYRGLTQTQTAKVLGVSQVQVSRLERRALDKLRRELTS